jgi:hypothetical protein
MIVSFRGNSLACSHSWVEKIGNNDMNEAVSSQNLTLKCQQRCELQSQTPVLSSSAFPVESIFPKHQFFCLTLFKVARICNDSNRAKLFEATQDHVSGITCNEILIANNTNKMCISSNVVPNSTIIQQNLKIVNFLYKYAKNNLVVLNVFIKDPYYTLIKQDEQMSLISFLGNAGGLVGLCMGLSVVSIFEIFYHIVNFILLKMLCILTQRN